VLPSLHHNKTKGISSALFATAIIARWAWVFNSPLVPLPVHGTFAPISGKKKSPFTNADKIIALEGGHIIEIGDHRDKIYFSRVSNNKSHPSNLGGFAFAE
jgi:hypothetical protein